MVYTLFEKNNLFKFGWTLFRKGSKTVRILHILYINNEHFWYLQGIAYNDQQNMLIIFWSTKYVDLRVIDRIRER